MCNGNRVCFRWRTCSSRINFHPDDRCSFTFLRISQVVRLAKRKEEDNTSFPETGFHDKNKLPARPFWSFLHISLSYITLREERERTESIQTGLQIGTATRCFFARKTMIPHAFCCTRKDIYLLQGVQILSFTATIKIILKTCCSASKNFDSPSHLFCIVTNFL